MNTSILALLQMTASLLLAAQGNANMTPAVQAQLVNVTERVVQIVDQANASIPFTVPQSKSIYPGYTDLLNAPYLDINGKYVQLGSAVALENNYISFGDLNGDGLDDAVVVVKRTQSDGTTAEYLAALINQGGILFNIADAPLPAGITINSHHVDNGVFTMNKQIGTAAAATSTYQLIGTSFVIAGN